MASVLDGAYQTSGEIWEQASKLYKPSMLEEIRGIETGEIVVVAGVHDHVERLLDTLKIPYDTIASDNIPTHNGGRVFFANCKRYSTSNKMQEATRELVSSGGRLVTTDWALDLVSQSFPGKYTKTGSSPDAVVEIDCITPISRELIGMNSAQCRPQWWLEASSDIYSIGKGVTPIITSREMESRFGQAYVMSGFQHGEGEAIHFISHLELQRTRQKGKSAQGSLDDFLAKMQIERTDDMDDMGIAELEAAYSTLNTVAYLCLRGPVLERSSNSVMATTHVGSVAKSTRLV